MDLFSADTLHIEHPGGFRNALFRTTFRVDVYDEHGVPLATAGERDGPGALAFVRATGFSGHLPYDLRVTMPGGREVLGIAKGFSGRSAQVDVTGQGSAPLGSLRRQGAHDIAVSDADGRSLGVLTQLAELQVGTLARREGRKVRRDVLRMHPDLGSPARELAIAAAIAFDIVHNKGTTKPSGWSWHAG